MALDSLLLITNKHNEDPEEDIFLAGYLSDFFDISLVDITDAPGVLSKFKKCLIRNAWPSRLFEKEFDLIQKIFKQNNTKLYNPNHRNFVEDKTYLLNLFEQNFPVIPTINKLTDLQKLGSPDSYIIKPNDGCSSVGVEELSGKEIVERDLSGYIIQPTIQFKDETSFYYIDDIFVYATVSAGPDKRWELQEYTPIEIELDWAKQFVVWNKLPYGLQRIDACRLKDGELLLMEIEDTFPLLSLGVLSERSKEKVLACLTDSLRKNL